MIDTPELDEGDAVGTELEPLSPFGPFDALAEWSHKLYLDGYGERAIAVSRQALAFVEAARDERTARYLQFICGVALHQLGRAAEASEEAGRLLRRLGPGTDPVWRAKALALLAESRVDLGMTALAMDHLAEGKLIVSAQRIRTYDHLSATMSVALALNALALFEPADELMVQMLALTFPPARVRLNVAQEAAVLQTAWGSMLEVAGRAAEAWPHYTEALSRTARMRALAAEADYPEMRARAEAIEAFVLHRTGHEGLGLARLRPAMDAFRLREELAETQIARIALALATSDAGDQDTAAELLAAVQRVSSATQLDVWGLTALAVRARNAVQRDGRSDAADALEQLAQVSLARLWEDRESRFEALQDRIRQREMAEQHERIGRASLVDPMTGLGNRRRLQQVLERPDQRFAAVLLDIDRFRTVNDEHGQEIGDAVLRRTADLVQRNVGDGDVVVRYGADEFVVLVPGGFGAAATAERLLEVVRKEPWLEISLGLRITVSVGLAGPAPAAEALAAADLAAAEAKRAGRDRLVTA
ncbi:diguanylate cyclase [Kineococcus aurantiacus]|uniref:Diguanylate cyclase (GGDEF)-like protein n=1 Tax=Kineococcus aurantiacus TaxID=37633 RepID=A0A7Y9ATP7_9ACTN|nr:diguanylate cyclase (GGDEF)-like protein [Kineococcus aurantiacus]